MYGEVKVTIKVTQRGDVKQRLRKAVSEVKVTIKGDTEGVKKGKGGDVKERLRR